MLLHYNSRKYRVLVEWIALNDGVDDNPSIDELAHSLTVTMIAHCYNMKNVHVAEDVMQYRRQTERKEG